MATSSSIIAAAGCRTPEVRRRMCLTRLRSVSSPHRKPEISVKARHKREGIRLEPPASRQPMKIETTRAKIQPARSEYPRIACLDAGCARNVSGVESNVVVDLQHPIKHQHPTVLIAVIVKS